MRRPLRVGAYGQRASRQRRRERRKRAERRLRNQSWIGEERRRSIDRRSAQTRRDENPSEYYRVETEQIRQWVERPEGISGGVHVGCPRCPGQLVAQRPIKWVGGITVFEVRCTDCPRIAVIRSEKAKWRDAKSGVWQTLKGYISTG